MFFFSIRVRKKYMEHISSFIGFFSKFVLKKSKKIDVF